MCKRFLSVDWDFFPDASADFRHHNFPEGGAERFSNDVKDFVWKFKYQYCPELEHISVKSKEYYQFKRICREFRGISSIVTESHSMMYEYVLNNTEDDEEFEVYNVDFHHDLYGDAEELFITCGNWARNMLLCRPYCTYRWVGQDDSDKRVYEQIQKVVGSTFIYPFKTIVKTFDTTGFDYLFICRSNLWSPPHLDIKFREAVNELFYDRAYCDGGKLHFHDEKED